MSKTWIWLLLFGMLWCAARSTFAQDPLPGLPAPSFIGETLWGCSREFSATKQWAAIPGASGYQVRIDQGPWQDVGLMTEHEFPLTPLTLTGLYVRALQNGAPGATSHPFYVIQYGIGDCTPTPGWPMPGRRELPEESSVAARAPETPFSSGIYAVSGADSSESAPHSCSEQREPRGVRVSVGGVHGRAQCIDGAQIGQRALAGRILNAVDIWGPNVAPGTEVCFVERGRIVFLDARTSPRQQSELNTYASDDGLTCARIPGPGSALLLRQ